MKECPVCKAKCFEDMEVCYGCLHEFKEEESCFKEFDLELPDVKLKEGLEQQETPAGHAAGVSEKVEGTVFRLEVPAGLKSFTVRCEGLQIEGTLS